MQYVPNLGETPADDARRDAVHVAVAPVIAGMPLRPGMHIELRAGVAVGDSEDGLYPNFKPIGVVDPFLRRIVQKDERFWIFLYPNTVTSLRHVWSHPAFGIRVPEAQP